MANSDVVRARIDGHIKEEATNVLAGMGLSVSDAIRMLLPALRLTKHFPLISIPPNSNPMPRGHKFA